jgi:ParB-like chromosome segregation protein Spo0J
MTDLSVELVPTVKVKPYENNVRVHSKKQIAKLAESIKVFGFTNPVLIDSDDTVIAGHGRLEAAKLLKMDNVPCIRLTHLTPEQRRAYLIADNRLAEVGGDWDEAALKVELSELQSLGNVDFGLIGFDEEELNRMLATMDKREADVKPDMEEEFNKYLTNTIRQIVLHYEGEAYAKVVERLDAAGERFGTETNSETLVVLLDYYEAYSDARPARR